MSFDIRLMIKNIKKRGLKNPQKECLILIPASS